MQQFNFRDFLARQTDDALEETDLGKALACLPTLTASGPYLAGGALRRTLIGQPLDSDFDFFFQSEAQFNEFLQTAKAKGAYEVIANEHNVTLGRVRPHPKNNLKIQAIRTQWYTSAAAVADSFDFTICQFVFDGESLFCGDYALWDLARRRLIPHRVSYATSTLRRLIKYADQGYTVCAGGLSTILQQVVDDPAVIEARTLYID